MISKNQPIQQFAQIVARQQHIRRANVTLQVVYVSLCFSGVTMNYDAKTMWKFRKRAKSGRVIALRNTSTSLKIQQNILGNYPSLFDELVSNFYKPSHDFSRELLCERLLQDIDVRWFTKVPVDTGLNSDKLEWVLFKEYDTMVTRSLFLKWGVVAAKV